MFPRRKIAPGTQANNNVSAAGTEMEKYTDKSMAHYRTAIEAAKKLEFNLPEFEIEEYEAPPLPEYELPEYKE